MLLVIFLIYFPKISDGSNLRNGAFWIITMGDTSQSWQNSHSYRIMGSHCLETERNKHWCSVHIFFIQPGNSEHGMVLFIVTMGISTSAKPTKILSQKHPQSLVIQVILDPVDLTVNINHHNDIKQLKVSPVICVWVFTFLLK